METGPEQEIRPSISGREQKQEAETPKTAEQPIPPERKENTQLGELRVELEQQQGTQQLKSPRTVQPPPPEKFRGFWQRPDKVIRNTVNSPAMETRAVILSGATIIGLPAALSIWINPSPINWALWAGAFGAAGFEALQMYKGRENLGMLIMMKIRPNTETQLRDGKLVSLDSWVGELHIDTNKVKEFGEMSSVDRTLKVAEGTFKSLLELVEKIEEGEEPFSRMEAFRGASHLITLRIERLGFEVRERPKDLGGLAYRILTKIQKRLTLGKGGRGVIGGEGETREIWISKEQLVVHKEDFQRELDRVQSVLTRRGK